MVGRTDTVEARPWIDKQGDLELIKEPGEAKNLATEKRKQIGNEKARKILSILRANDAKPEKQRTQMSANKLCDLVGGRRNDCYSILTLGEGKWWFKEGEGKSSNTSYHALEKVTK